MILMALDHTRSFLSSARFEPVDLVHTTPALFLTRWVTHFCVPVFFLLAGLGPFLSLARGRTVREISRFFLTRASGSCCSSSRLFLSAGTSRSRSYRRGRPE